jgi:1-acyl-sn-glycerol-3-phosphate acyltransferase
VNKTLANQMTDQLALVSELRERLIEDVLKYFSNPASRWLRHLFRPLIAPPADRFARIAVQFEGYLARLGFQDAAQRILPNFVSGMQVTFREDVPQQGPLLVVSNHPGTIDSLTIAANVPRDDLKIVASGFSFLRSLPLTTDRLIFATSDIQERMLVIRRMVRHLRDGGALLIFPSGTVDPDPEILPGAREALSRWSPSIEFVLRAVPQTQLLVTIVSGVITWQAFRHPITRLKKGVAERQKVAEVIQVIQGLSEHHKSLLSPKLTIGSPLPLSDLLASYETPEILGIIHAKALQLLNDHILTHQLSPRKVHF